MADTRSKPEANDIPFMDAGETTSWPKSNAAFVTGYLVSIAMTAVAVIVAFGLDGGARIPNLSLVFVIPVIVAGVSFGLGPSLCAAVLGAVAYNFFFVEPRYSLMVDDPANLWAIVLLLLVGLVVSTIAFTSRRRATAVAVLTREVGILRGFSRDIVAADGSRAILSAGSQALASLFQVPAVAMVFRDGNPVSVTATDGVELQEADVATAKSALDMGAVARAGTYPAQDSRFDFWPVGSASGPSVVIGLSFGGRERPALQDELVDIVSSGLALALDRVNLRSGDLRAGPASNPRARE